MKKVLKEIRIGAFKGLLLIAIIFASFISHAQTEIPLREKAAQMIMVGFRGTEINEKSQIVSDLRDLKIGGVVFFEYDVPSKSRPRNITSPQQLKKLCTDLQNLTEETIFIAIDQEGGNVNRLKMSYGFPKTVSAQYLGTIDNEDSTRFYAAQMAKTLSNAGINLDFAPCVDVNVNPGSPVIGKIGRSFSENPALVTKHAAIFVEELRKNEVLSCLKHFPGHGSATTDSHEGFTDVTKTWKSIELEPYSDLINRQLCDAVMSSHVFNTHLDSKYPGTLSHQIITGILRDSLNWNGCIFSDDMNMGAISKNFGFKESIALAVNSGIDVLIFSNNAPEGYDPKIALKVLDTIMELVSEGVVSEQVIENSYQRIIQLKHKIEKQ